MQTQIAQILMDFIIVLVMMDTKEMDSIALVIITMPTIKFNLTVKFMKNVEIKTYLRIIVRFLQLVIITMPTMKFNLIVKFMKNVEIKTYLRIIIVRFLQLRYSSI